MTIEQYNKIFEDTVKNIEEKYSSVNFQEIIDQYSDSNGNISLPDLFSFAFIESHKKSVYFMHELLKNFVDIEEGE